MPMEAWEHDGDTYCLQATRLGDGWYFELGEARAAPTTRTDVPRTEDVLPGPVVATVIAYDPDEEKPPSVHFDTDRELPFEALRWFIARRRVVAGNAGKAPDAGGEQPSGRKS